VFLLGGYAPDQAALTRFFSLHYLLPFVIAGVVILHIWALHIPGSGNPTGVDVKSEKDTLPFHPFYTAKDGWFAGAFMILFIVVTFFAPEFLGHADNNIPADPLATPAHIVPEWYFWPFYAILRAFTVDFILDAKLWGVLAMFASILLLFLLPWLDKSPVRSGSYRPLFKRFFWILVVDVLILGWAGGSEATPLVVAVSQVATIYYFLHFLVILPIVSRIERPLALPMSISESVLHGEAAEAAPAGSAPRGGSTATVSQ
jgi:ubiquinol-cytochrome c reductase cytochrome b subunit